MTGDSIGTFFACESVSLKLKPSKKFARTVRNRRLRLVIRVTAKEPQAT